MKSFDTQVYNCFMLLLVRVAGLLCHNLITIKARKTCVKFPWPMYSSLWKTRRRCGGRVITRKKGSKVTGSIVKCEFMVSDLCRQGENVEGVMHILFDEENLSLYFDNMP